ncbi:hypothetical protein C8Q80DRAFT_774917 [Daedaleopsis nitida]|nr:hypothetical protein C8Q80DRAFT_774917 [Daedaleopsis nitida]
MLLPVLRASPRAPILGQTDDTMYSLPRFASSMLSRSLARCRSSIAPSPRSQGSLRTSASSHKLSTTAPHHNRQWFPASLPGRQSRLLLYLSHNLHLAWIRYGLSSLPAPMSAPARSIAHTSSRLRGRIEGSGSSSNVQLSRHISSEGHCSRPPPRPVELRSPPHLRSRSAPAPQRKHSSGRSPSESLLLTSAPPRRGGRRGVPGAALDSRRS